MRLLILSFLFCSQAFAVVTKDCPQQIQLKLSSFSLDTLAAQYDDEDCWYDCYNEPGLEEAQNTLKALESIEVKLQLTSARSAVCQYKGELNSLPVFAKIDGTFNPHATKKATLTTYWNSLVFYTGLSSMKPESITSLSPVSGLYYNGEHCSWGECIPDHIRVGLANSTELKVIK